MSGPSPSPVAPRTRLGHYEVVDLLGAGGMGEVFRARDPRLGREVAVKVIAFDVAAQPDRLRRFEQEARAVAALDHPNILSVFDVGTTESGLPYVVFERLEGETLGTRLVRERVPLRKAADWAAQAARGLGAAHERGIVHRDLKPENLFVTRDGRVKVLDFGLAKLVRGEDAVDDGEGPTRSAATEPGAVMGTAGYMSPEKVRGVSADARSDIFSLGAVLYEMVARRRAFRGETAAEMMTAILKEDPPELVSEDGPVPLALKRIVRRCLEKRPEERFQSARDLAFALEALLGSAPSLTVPPVPTGVPRRRALAGLAIVAAGVAAATLWHVGRPGRSTEEPIRLSVPFDASRRTIDGEAAPFGEPVSFLRPTGSALFSASPDGRALVYVPLPAPVQLTWLDRAGRPAGTVGDPAHLFGVRLSPDGKKTAAHIFDLRKGARDIWVDDLEAPGVRFPRDWSPDGERIVLEDFSPDRRVRSQLWVLSLGPPARLAPFAHGPANKYHARFSPDGRHLALTSEETGRPEVVVASLDGASHRQVSSEGGFLPRWRGDGRELFYLTPHGELVAVSVTPGPQLAVGGRRPLFSLRVGPSGAISQSGSLSGPEYDATADGQRFLFSLGAEPAGGSFVVLFGWQRALRP